MKKILKSIRKFNFLTFLRKLYPEKAQKTNIVNPYSDKIADALIEAQKEIIVKRKRNWAKKSRELGDNYNARLNQYLNIFFAKYSDDKDDNDISFDVLNNQWIKYSQEANASQNKVNVSSSAFKEQVDRIVSSKDFQEQLAKSKSK